MADPELPGQVATSARYENLQFLAAGGLGEVYRATDASLHREVALKFIQQRHLEKPEFLELFFLEAEITSRLDHPGVVPVYGVGETTDKRPFYVMRYIEGIALRDAIDKYHQTGAVPRELHRLLTHLVVVCNTVAYAHNRGVVHCDIKPDNIMLGKFGETLLVDWGLATTVERDERARASGEKTMRVKDGNSSSIVPGKSSGSAAGTLGYMSPEQHPEFMNPIRPASDIYSLGATLYCVLTGRAPLEGASETLLLDKLRYGEFPRPREIDSHVPKALEAICLTAMAQYESERYPTALEMAADLEAWLADEPVSVHRESVAERLARWARRNRMLVILGLIGLALALLLALGAAFTLTRTAAREAWEQSRAAAADSNSRRGRDRSGVSDCNADHCRSKSAFCSST